MIAEVIVDIKNKAVDRVFDYEVPPLMAPLIQPGVRVLVPFGPRTVMGFVAAVKNETQVKKLRPIAKQLDLSPVLNDEMRQLAKSLSVETGATLIKVYEAMIPSAMRAAYRKKAVLLAGSAPPRLHQYFNVSNVIDYDLIPAADLPALKEAVSRQEVEVVYEVRDKLGKKTEKSIRLTAPVLDWSPFARAQKQREVLEQLLAAGEMVLKKELNGSAVKALLAKGVVEEVEVESYRDPFGGGAVPQTLPLALNPDQEEAVGQVRGAGSQVFLLHGITGSGKTEVYLQMIEEVLGKGRQALMLVPEISLTPQISARFKGRFQDQVAVLHSGLSMGEKYDEWRRILKGEVQVAVGARSAVFAPFKDLGIIIVDEEHEATYKQDEMPRYHAIEVAKHRSAAHDCPLVLGSATPSLESFARAKKGVYRLLSLPSRAVKEASLPEVELIDMRQAYIEDSEMLISRQLQEAVGLRLERGEQVVLLLNRRGYSNFLQCRECGEVAGCPHCDVSLNYHKSGQRLRCHYCGYDTPVPNSCPACQSREIRFFGTGTQKVEEYVQGLFPSAKILRMDVDTTTKKGSHQQLIQQFEKQKAQILIGTQMVGKGLDFPKVTLVGVLAADLMLHLPDYKAAERTFQLLTQVAGRAGRHQLPGQVLIQTYTPEHYVMQRVLSQDYEGFYQDEMKVRRQFGYPPYFFLASVILTSVDYNELVLACDKVNQFLRSQLGASCLIAGPTMPSVGRVNDHFRMYFIVKYKNEPNLRPVLGSLLGHFQEGPVSLSLDYYPNQMA